jgi:hypothetical protein
LGFRRVAVFRVGAQPVYDVEKESGIKIDAITSPHKVLQHNVLMFGNRLGRIARIRGIPSLLTIGPGKRRWVDPCQLSG